MRAAVYTRISRDREGTAAGVQRQRRDCLAFCKSRNIEVVSVFEDNDVSAYSGKPRPAYAAMLDALADGTVDTVVAWHPDRLHRALRELLDFIDAIEAANAAVFTVTAGHYDLTTTDGQMVARMLGVVAQKESDDKSRRIRRKHQELAENGSFHGGGRPFGYACSNSASCAVADCAHDGTSIIRHEAKAIRKGVDAVLAGRSIASVMRTWNDAGLLTPRGGVWRQQVVRRALLAPRLAGLREHHGKVVAKAAWGPIIDVQTHERVKALLTAPDRYRSPGNSRAHTLSGFLRCGKCDRRLFAAVTNNAPAFACKKDQEPGSCGALVVKMEPLNGYVRDAVLDRLSNADTFFADLASIQPDDPTSDEATDEIARCIQLLDQLHHARWQEGSISKGVYLEQLNRLEARIDSAYARLRQTGTARILIDAKLLTVDDFALAWGTKGLEFQRALIDALLDRVTILPAMHRGARFDGDERVRFTWR